MTVEVNRWIGWLPMMTNADDVEEEIVHNSRLRESNKITSFNVTYNLNASFWDQSFLPLLLCTPIWPVLDQLNYAVPLAIDRLLSDQPFLFLFYSFFFLFENFSVFFYHCNPLAYYFLWFYQKKFFFFVHTLKTITHNQIGYPSSPQHSRQLCCNVTNKISIRIYWKMNERELKFFFALNYSLFSADKKWPEQTAKQIKVNKFPFFISMGPLTPDLIPHLSLIISIAKDAKRKNVFFFILVITKWVAYDSSYFSTLQFMIVMNIYIRTSLMLSNFKWKYLTRHKIRLKEEKQYEINKSFMRHQTDRNEMMKKNCMYFKTNWLSI